VITIPQLLHIVSPDSGSVIAAWELLQLVHNVDEFNGYCMIIFL
jgi:hypothetical protein